MKPWLNRPRLRFRVAARCRRDPFGPQSARWWTQLQPASARRADNGRAHRPFDADGRSSANDESMAVAVGTPAARAGKASVALLDGILGGALK